MTTKPLLCDGCGQYASAEHIARRLQRLEWTTRYRPVHIGKLLLGAVSPQANADFLYAGMFSGEAGRLLEIVGVNFSGKSPEGVLTEFQRGGYFLTHVLECPLEENGTSSSSYESMLAARAKAVTARIRRSLKPKRTVLISERLEAILGALSPSELQCPVLLDAGKPFALDRGGDENRVRLREALSGMASAV